MPKIPRPVTLWSDLCESRGALVPGELGADVCSTDGERAREAWCAESTFGAASSFPGSCRASVTATHRGHHRTSLLAHLLEPVGYLEEHWRKSQNLDDLRLLRLLRAVIVGTATRDPQMVAMEATACEVLRRHEEMLAEPAYSAPQHPRSRLWQRRATSSECEQPYPATFHITSGDPGAMTRKELAQRLRADVQEASEWGQIAASGDWSRHLSLAHHTASWAVSSLDTTYRLMRPSIDDEHLRSARPLLSLTPMTADDLLSPEVQGLEAKLVRDIYDRTHVSEWASLEVAERVVRVFLRALGLPKEQARSLFDPERKAGKRAAHRATRASDPDDEGGSGAPH